MPLAFVPNPAGIAALTREQHMAASMARIAAELEAEAKGIAPVETGAYRDSLRGEVELGEHGWEAHLVTDSPYWPYLEFGTSDTPMFATLRTALSLTRI